MERLFIESPVDEVDAMVAEAMEERFNTIVEYLQECVDEDTMTLEDANEIAEIAYEKYMMENKVTDFVKNHKKAIAIGAGAAAGATAAGVAIYKNREKVKELITKCKEKIRSAIDNIRESNRLAKSLAKMSAHYVAVSGKIASSASELQDLYDHVSALYSQLGSKTSSQEMHTIISDISATSAAISKASKMYVNEVKRAVDGFSYKDLQTDKEQEKYKELKKEIDVALKDYLIAQKAAEQYNATLVKELRKGNFKFSDKNKRVNVSGSFDM